ncbi:MAG: cation-transporting P-type ATPase [Pirellulales bacterium]|nr:cation-transporting P-type ATPase [Pirellulales bacterium]
MQTLLGHHWHHLSSEEVLELLESHEVNGLDHFAVENRQEHFGPNVISEKRKQGPLFRFLLQFHQPLIYILLVAVVVTGMFKEWVDAVVILGVVVINAIVGFVQESKALGAIAALARSIASEATVVRSGKKTRLPSESLVPGDIVLLQSGDKVPADLRLTRSRDLQIDESALTGESVPAQKGYELLPKETGLADRKNMAFSSTLVTFGTGTGVVIATGDRTEIGQISEMISSTEVLDTPLMQKIKHFSHFLLVLILALAALTFTIDILRGKDWLFTFKVAVALAIGAIPEGLPAAMTIMLAIGVSRMARRNAIIRRLPAVETLGSVTVICSDKTGTLTKNQMTVQEMIAGNRHYEVRGTGYDPTGQIVPSQSAEGDSALALNECLRAGLLCNDAALVDQEGLWQVQGDPTEGALLVAALKGGLSQSDEQAALPRIDAIPFESQHQYMATLHDSGAGEPALAYLKGSVESILPKCRARLEPDGEEQPIDTGGIHRQADALATKGLRVLAFAKKTLASDTKSIHHTDVADGLVFLGLQGMIDPPRPEAAQAVATCQRAGIQVKMITGDHAKTAGAIARNLNIAGVDGADGTEHIVTGQQLGSLSDDELSELMPRTAVFARVSPEHKLRLVQALQARGEVVAMTGDGVNDAPALRRADIGVAMALGGTEVAREAADMILTDDNFASIESAVEEGRGVFDTLLKFIVWTLPTNGGEGLTLLLAVFLNTALPIEPVQLLWINMTTAVFLGMMLAFERPESGIMLRPPRDPAVSLLTSHLLRRIVLVSVLLCAGAFGLFKYELATGADKEQAWTVVTAVFVFGEAFYLLNCRSLTRSALSVGLFSNPWIWGGIAIMTLLQLAFTYLPTMNTLFHSAPIGAGPWIRILGVGIVIHAAVGFEKWLISRAEEWKRIITT